MRSGVINEREWIPLREASKITGRSVHALRLLINRGRIEKVRKQQVNGQSYWEIHQEAVSLIRGDTGASHGTSHEASQGPSHTYQQASHGTSHENLSPPSQVITIPVEYYEQQQKERDNLMQGMTMYRYKFEELERQTRLLPAPLEVIPLKLTELEHREEALRTSQQAINDLETKLQTRQKAINELEAELQRERSVTWWQRLWRK